MAFGYRIFCEWVAYLVYPFWITNLNCASYAYLLHSGHDLLMQQPCPSLTAILLGDVFLMDSYAERV